MEKPTINGIPIYIDGQLDKTHEAARIASFGARLMGYAAFKAFEATVLVVDDFYQAVQPPKQP